MTSLDNPELRAVYEAAVYEVEFADGPREFVVGRDESSAPPFVIVTAWNPAGVDLCVDENVARNTGLGAAIAARGWTALPAQNHADDGSQMEPGFAIFGAPIDEVTALAWQFGQLAVFRWDGHEGHVVWLPPDTDEPNG